MKIFGKPKYWPKHNQRPVWQRPTVSIWSGLLVLFIVIVIGTVMLGMHRSNIRRAAQQQIDNTRKEMP